MDPYLRIIDRGTIFEAARHALDQYQWLVSPDFDQEGAVQAAERGLAAAPGATPLIAAARGFHAWLDQGGDRRAGRSALVRSLVPAPPSPGAFSVDCGRVIPRRGRLSLLRLAAGLSGGAGGGGRRWVAVAGYLGAPWCAARARLRWSPQGAHRVLQVRAAAEGENFAARICPSIGSNGVHVVFSIALSGKDQLKTKTHMSSAPYLKSGALAAQSRMSERALVSDACRRTGKVGGLA